jgi:hypothetical protein
MKLMQHDKKKTMKPTGRSSKKQISLVLPDKTTPTAAVPATPAPSQPAPGAPTKVNHAAIAEQIATQLGETKPFPRNQIKRIIWALGHRQALDLVKRAQGIEAAGGMMVTSGKRRRTVGGIFFHLAYSEGKPKPGRELKRPTWRRKREKPAEVLS